MKKTTPLLFLLASLMTTLTQACAVCFGGADSNLSRGFFWGIIVLGLLPFALLTFFITTIVYSTRKKHR